MNIDRALVNRALLKAGQTTLTDEDINNNSEAWKTVKEFYLSTMLETLARTQWTSAKRRTQLHKNEEAENLSIYEIMYDLPVDCARAVKLNSESRFIVEGQYLYTNDSDAVLMYITNGRTDIALPTEPPEDIPGYDYIDYGPDFWEYIETRLASKIVLKITGDLQLYNLLFTESMVIEDAAAKSSKAAGKSKPTGQTYWTDAVVGRM